MNRDRNERVFHPVHMKRERKYRAFDTKFNVMLYGVAVFSEDSICIPDTEAHRAYGNKFDERMEDFECSVPEWYLLSKEFILMDYIGQDDSSKMPIYEGDATHYTFDYDDPKLKKKAKRYVGFVKWNAEHSAFNIMQEPEDTNGWVMNGEHFFQLEVIGNIYENPELLNSPDIHRRKPSLAGSRRKNKSE